jgi:hypothetical protein
MTIITLRAQEHRQPHRLMRHERNEGEREDQQPRYRYGNDRYRASLPEALDERDRGKLRHLGKKRNRGEQADDERACLELERESDENDSAV